MKIQIRKFLWVVCGCLSSASLLGQTPATTTRSISLDECIEMALKNNFDLKIERHNVHQAKLELQQAQTLYDPTLIFSSGRARNSGLSQTWSLFDERTVRENRTDTDLLSAEVQGQGPMGLQYGVPLDFTRRSGDGYSYTRVGPGFILEDVPYKEYTGAAAVELRQPLLKDFAVDAQRLTVQVNRKFLKISEEVFKQLMLDTITAVRVGYYDLIFAQESVRVQAKALELAEKLLSDNKAKVKAGTLPPLDEKQAESQVAITKADLISAKQTLMVRENLLKNLIVNDLPEWKGIVLKPVEQLLAVPEVFDVQESWRTGLIKRPDLAQLRTDLDRRDLEVRYFKNQTLPELNLVGRYGHNALGVGAEDVLYDVNKPDSTFYYYGVELRFPWGNRAAKYRHQREKDQRIEAQLRTQKLEQDIMVQIDNAISVAQSGFDRVEATRQAREYSEMALDAEQKKLENGKSTSFFVLQFQRDVTAARSAENQALADYNKAVARLHQVEGTAIEKLKITVEFK